MKVYTKDNNGDPGNIFLPHLLQEWTTAFTSKARFKNEMFLTKFLDSGNKNSLFTRPPYNK